MNARSSQVENEQQRIMSQTFLPLSHSFMEQAALSFQFPDEV